MKGGVLGIFILFGLLVNSQNCLENRYVDPLFSVNSTLGINYGSAVPYLGLLPQQLDLDFYEPAGDTLSKRPIIVFVFGGGFLIGDKRFPDIPLVANHFTERGYCFASIDYRLGFNLVSGPSAERAVYRGVQDLRASLRYLAQNASTYRIDTSNIILMGSSAGCFIGLHTTYMDEIERPPSSYGIPLEPNDLGCGNCSGNSFYGNKDVPIKAMVNRWGAIGDTAWIENTLRDSIPLISFHGDNDPTVPYGVGFPFSVPLFPQVYGSSIIHQRLSNLGVQNEFHTLSGAGHEPQLLENPRWGDTVFKYSIPFLHEVIRPKTKKILGPERGCTGDTLMYYIQGNPSWKYCWSVSGGQIISNNGPNVFVEWTNTGFQEISLFTQNDIDARSLEQKLEVEISTSNSVFFTYQGTDGLYDFTTPNVNDGSLTWIFANSDSSNLTAPNYQFDDTGFYQVELQVNNGYCVSSYHEEIRSNLCPNVQFNLSTSDSFLIIQPDVQFEVTQLWSFDNGLNFDLISDPTVVSFDQEGVYNVICIAQNDFCSDTLEQSITVDFCPIAGFSTSTNGLQVLLNNSASNVDAIFWDLGDGTVSSILNLASYIYEEEGEYTIVQYVYNQNGCSDTIENSIFVEENRANPNSVLGLNSNFEFYPNPTNGKLHFENIREDMDWIIYDMLGNQVDIGIIGPNKLFIEFSDLQNSIYFLHLSSSNAQGKFVRRIVKK